MLSRFLSSKTIFSCDTISQVACVTLSALLANTVAENLTEKIRRDVWDSVAFFNFVPVVAAPFPRHYSPLEPFFAKTWRPSEIELVH